MHLVNRAQRHRVLLLSGIAALFAAVSSTVSLSNVGIYTNALPPELVPGTLGFDVMSLVVSLALVGCLLALERGHDRYWLPWIGLQGYLFYAYAVFAFGFIYTSLYFFYIAIIGLSAYALAIFGRAINPALLRHWKPTKLPRRTMGAILIIVASVFGVSWATMLLTAIVHDLALPAASVIVLDLAFALPLLAIVAALLFFKRPMGDILAPGVLECRRRSRSRLRSEKCCDLCSETDSAWLLRHRTSFPVASAWLSPCWRSIASAPRSRRGPPEFPGL